MKYLPRMWRRLPLWVHIFSARVVRPRFRVAVAAIIFDEQQRVLLFKHTYRKFEWGIPAGGLEYHEQPVAALAREFFEEAGMQIRIERLLTAVSAREDHHVSLVYLCKIIGGEFAASTEISEMRYFDLDSLPAILIGERELIAFVAHQIRSGQ